MTINIYFAAFLCLCSFFAGAWVQDKTKDWQAPNWIDEEDE